MRQQQEKFMFLVVPIVDILLQTGWTVRYDVVTGLWLRQTEPFDQVVPVCEEYITHLIRWSRPYSF
jgi:hypothetical protein